MISTHVTLENADPVIQTSGGESWDWHDVKLDDYGITLDDLHIDGLSAKTASRLVCELCNHLMINGHRFELSPTGLQDMPMELKEIR